MAQHEDIQNQDEKAEAETVEQSATRTATSRRRLIAGAAAAPVVMTLASRPALGGGYKGVCMGSVSMSANVSRHGVNCVGHPPHYWKSKATNREKSRKFKDKLGVYPHNNPAYGGWTINTALNSGGNEAEMAAAWINAKRFGLSQGPGTTGFGFNRSGLKAWCMEHFPNDPDRCGYVLSIMNSRS